MSWPTNTVSIKILDQIVFQLLIGNQLETFLQLKLNDLDLWPIDLKNDWGHIGVMTNHHSKFDDCRPNGFPVIDRKPFKLTTYRQTPTNRQIDQPVPPHFFKRAEGMKMLISKHEDGQWPLLTIWISMRPDRSKIDWHSDFIFSATRKYQIWMVLKNLKEKLRSIFLVVSVFW